MDQDGLPLQVLKVPRNISIQIGGQVGEAECLWQKDPGSIPRRALIFYVCYWFAIFFNTATAQYLE